MSVCRWVCMSVCGWVCMSVCVCIQGVGSRYLWAVSLGTVCMSTEAASANTGPPALAFWLSNDQQRGLWLAGG